MRLSRRAALAVPFVLAVPGFATAADAEAAAPIVALNRAVLAGMKAGKASPFMTRYAALAPAIDAAFDVPGILETSVGPRFAGLPAEQKTKLLDLFRKFTIASYVANFDEFDGERLEVLPDQRAVGSDVVVPTQIAPARGDAVRIDYVMRRTAKGWRAVDVLLNGSISQNAVKRSDFRNLVTTASAQPLIDSLQRKVAELSGNTLT